MKTTDRPDDTTSENIGEQVKMFTWPDGHTSPIQTEEDELFDHIFLTAYRKAFESPGAFVPVGQYRGLDIFINLPFTDAVFLNICFEKDGRRLAGFIPKKIGSSSCTSQFFYDIDNYIDRNGKMKKAQLIYVVGDIHGDWGFLNDFIDREIRHNGRIWLSIYSTWDELEIIILQCGDFGYCPHIYNKFVINNQHKGIKDGFVKIYWCDGNHENHDALDALEAAHPGEPFIEVAPGVYFSTFGSILTLLDGTTVMFCGGADSIDKEHRLPGYSWWPQEIIDQKDMLSLPEPGTKRVDWIISHTGPTLFNIKSLLGNFRMIDDPSQHWLDIILHDYQPKRWWFAHFHKYLRGHHGDCDWMMLNMNYENSQWSEQLPLIVVESKNEK